MVRNLVFLVEDFVDAMKRINPQQLENFILAKKNNVNRGTGYAN